MRIWTVHFSLLHHFHFLPLDLLICLQVPSGCRPTGSLPRTSSLVPERHSCTLAPTLRGKTGYSQGSLVSALSVLRAASQPQPPDFIGMVTSQSLSSANTKRYISQKHSFISAHQAWGGEIYPSLPHGHGKQAETQTHSHTLQKNYFQTEPCHGYLLRVTKLVFCLLLASPTQVFQPFPVECGVLTAYYLEASAETEPERAGSVPLEQPYTLHTLPHLEMEPIQIDAH